MIVTGLGNSPQSLLRATSVFDRLAPLRCKFVTCLGGAARFVDELLDALVGHTEKLRGVANAHPPRQLSRYQARDGLRPLLLARSPKAIR